MTRPLTSSRTTAEISTFITAWLKASSTREVAFFLAGKHNAWPFSTSTSSLTQFACQLRSGGVHLPYMSNAGATVDIDFYNDLIARG